MSGQASPPPPPTASQGVAASAEAAPSTRSPWAKPAKVLGWLCLLGSPGPVALACGLCGFLDLKMNPHRTGGGALLFGFLMGGVSTMVFVLLSPSSAALALGLTLLLFGYLWLVFIAFRESELWGGGTALVPIVWLIFALTRIQKSWGPLIVAGIGLTFTVVAFVLRALELGMVGR